MEKLIERLERLDYIDILRALAMILVIVGHLSFVDDTTHKYIYSFHMPLFFMCYGLTYKPKNYDLKTLKNIVISKLKRLYLPYILWTLFFTTLALKNVLNILYASHRSLIYSSNSHLWFLPCFLVCTLLFEFINAALYRFNVTSKIKNLLFAFGIPIFACLSIALPTSQTHNMPMCFNVALMGLAFVIIGYFTQTFIKHFKLRDLHLGFKIIIFICLILLTFTYNLNDIKFVSMADNYYGSLLYFLLTATVGSWAMIILSIILDGILFKSLKNFLIFIGQNTIAIIAIHHAIIIMFEKRIFFSSFPKPLFIPTIMITIFTLIVCYFDVKFINRFIPALNGKAK